MSWGFGGIAANNPQGVTPAANAAADLEAIETEQLGFQALGGEKKVKLLSSTWPADSHPSKTASLLAVASGRGLLAAGGPDSLALYETDAIRVAFEEKSSERVVGVSPRSTTTTPRLSHLAFASDESAVVITAERGGGLAVYDIQSANSGSTWTPSFQISTEGTAIRHLLPNPSPDASHVLAVVLEDGKLLLADLKSKSFVTTSGGNKVLREGAVCVSWSKKGKQIVVGLADGTAAQLDTQGTVKDTIPRPPSMSDGQQLPVTAIFWLENQDFFLIHSPTTVHADDADGMSPMVDAIFHLVHRDKDSKACSFHRFIVDPCPPFMDVGLPPHHFIQRIRDWLPNLDDTLIVACTASTDLGVFTRSKVALSQDLPADQITHTFTTTSFTDTRRAALPMSSNGIDDTFPVGVAIDLSSKQNVPKPIPNDETIDESATPLPQLCVLNQEGVLSAWWFVYNEAVRAKIAPPNTSTLVSPQQQSTLSPQRGTNLPAFGSSVASQAPIKPAFGQASTPAFGQPSAPALAQPSTLAFGQASTPASTSAFGQPSTPGAISAFGKPSAPTSGQTQTSTFGQQSIAFGNTSTPGLGTQSAFGATAPKTTFGAPSQLGLSSSSSAFGQASGVGFNKASVWGNAAQGGTSNQTSSTFGQPPQSFGASKPAEKENPFAAFGKQHREGLTKSGASPFAGFAQSSQGTSPFASFTSQSNKLSPFAAQSQVKPSMPNETSFGSTVTLSSNNGSFGSASPFATSRFGQPSERSETTMKDGDTPREEKKEPSGLGDLGSFKLGSTFQSDGTAQDDKPSSKTAERSLFSANFGSALGEAASQPSKPEVSIKEEPSDSPTISLKDIPEVNEPKVAQANESPQGNTPPSKQTQIKSEPSATEDAPLPPDFLTKSKAEDQKTASNDAPLPPDFLASSKTVAQLQSSNQPPLPSLFGSLTKPPPIPEPSSRSLFSNAETPSSPISTTPANALPNISYAKEEAGPAEDDDDNDPQDWEGVSEEDDASQEQSVDGDEAGDGEHDDDEGEEEWDDEDEDEDEDNEDESEADHTPQIVDPKGLAAFTARISPASPNQTQPKKESTTPESVQKPSFTPAGFPKLPINFAPPRTTQDSPRSPSPVRTDRAVTSPVRLSQQQHQQSVFQPLSSVQQPNLTSSRLKASTGDVKSSLFKSTQAPPSIEALEDEDDARVQQILSAPIVPSTTLPGFIAHQDYAGASNKEGIAGQLERVYRDVNGMIDTLGLNARALQAFAAGNAARQHEPSLDDLEDGDLWTIGDIYALEKLQAAIDDKLENGKLTDITNKVDEILEQDSHLDRLNAKAVEIRKQISLRIDPAKRAQQQAAALPPETASQQAELRYSVQNVQKLLAKAEESMGLLRADLATISATSPDTNGTATMPTVEAVTNTILKMTAMIEKKSGDVDLLEAQIKRLPGGFSALAMSASYEDGLIDSLAGSKLTDSQVGFTSPTRKRHTARSEALGLSGMLGTRSQGSATPVRQSTAFEPVGSVLGCSTTSLAGSARKKMADVTTEEVKAWRAKDAQRRNVLDSLRRVVANAGEPRIVRPSEVDF